MISKDIPLDRNISHSLGKVAPTERSQIFLSKLGARLAAEDVVEKVIIAGHTDDLGKPITNSILSHSRAQFAAQALASSGFSADKIEVQAFSDKKPVTQNETEKYKNRRIEVLFKGVKNEERLKEIIQDIM
jgi:outer membrane protein OmpA-like peptidoglycan-associated protein